MELKEKIIQTLREVIDPGTNMDVMSTGLIRNLTVSEDGAVSFEFHPSSPVCPMVLSLAVRIQETMNNLLGTGNLTITVKDHEMADMINQILREEGE